MADGTTPVEAHDTTFASLLWPRSAAGGTAGTRAFALMVLGACLLTISAKVNVPGPVPMTLQTLAVMVLGATLGLRLSVGAGRDLRGRGRVRAAGLREHAPAAGGPCPTCSARPAGSWPDSRSRPQ